MDLWRAFSSVPMVRFKPAIPGNEEESLGAKLMEGTYKSPKRYVNVRLKCLDWNEVGFTQPFFHYYTYKEPLRIYFFLITLL